MLKGLLRLIGIKPALPCEEAAEALPAIACLPVEEGDPLAESRERVQARRAENMLSGF